MDFPTPSFPELTEELPSAAARGPWHVDAAAAVGQGPRRLECGQRVVLGSGSDVDLRVADPAVSGRHAALEARPGFVELVDLESRNGTYLAGARVTRVRLQAGGAEFVIGRTAVSVRPVEAVEDVEDAPAVHELVGRSQGIARLRAEIARVAPLRAPVLIVGETGSGKDLVARALHRLGRPGRPWVPLNVAAVPEALADSELFGHQRGAFTGAVAARAGAFEQAHGGTLFLDEVADLGASLQARLLRVVEDGCVRPVGATRTVQVDVRLVSACWASLGELAAQGRFRADLLHRLSTVVLHVPPLRERKCDIPLLAEHWLGRVAAEVGPRELDSAALARLTAHTWPGNVRELGSVLYRAALAASGRRIGADAIDRALQPWRGGRAPAVEPRDVLAVLARHGGNTSRAARALGVPRSTLRSWVARARQRGAGTSGP